MYNAILQKWMPRAMHKEGDAMRDLNSDVYRRARLLLISLLVIIVFTAAYLPLVLLLLDYPLGTLPLLWGMLGAVGVAFFFRKTGNFKIAGNLIAFVLLVIFTTNTFFTGVYASSMWMLTVPISAFLYTGHRASGFAWTAICLAVISAFFIPHVSGYQFPALIESQYRPMGEYMGNVGVFLYVVVIINIYEKEKNLLVGGIRKSYAAIIEKNDEIQQQNEEILQQQEEIKTINENLESKNKNLTDLSEQVQQHNAKLTDSIRYAKSIQGAILPFGSRLEKAFSDHFTLYLPKDIVSGDFYWMEEAGAASKVLVAVGDCTGHGVPGAFMSIIGISILNDLVVKKQLASPARILEEMHELVRVALKQEDGLNSDGIDLALCAIEPFEGAFKVTFSGAKRPLVYVDASGSPQKIDGTRRSIGGYQGKKPVAFEEHALMLEPGTMLYLFSDGYADQNGPSSRSLGSGKFMDLLQQACRLDCPAQHDALQAALASYAQGEEQRDDITVFGIRL